MDQQKIKLNELWKEALLSEFDKDYMRNLKKFLVQEVEKKKMIFPRGSEFFEAFNQTPLDCVKVVILGQDPYHGPRQAHGLSFSVRPGVPIPPSLENIYKELESDIGFSIPSHGHLLDWAKRGVLLLNATLSVEAGKAGSHQGKRVGRVHQPSHRGVNPRKNPPRFYALGRIRSKKRSLYRLLSTLSFKSSSPFSIVCSQRFFWVQALLSS